MTYGIVVELDRLICRDTESLHSADRLGLLGVVCTDLGEAGFVLPMIQINSGQDVRIQNEYRRIFDGQSSNSEFGLALFGYDLDDNQAWIENREDIIKASSLIAKGVKLIPKVGAAIGKVLDEVNATVPPVLDQFVAWDKYDKLLDHQAIHKIPGEGVTSPVWQPLTIDFKRKDALGYSSWDYSLKLNIRGSAIGSFGPYKPGEAHWVPRRNTTPEAWIGTWEGTGIRAMISRSNVSGSLDISLLDKSTGATVSQSGVTISRLTLAGKSNPEPFPFEPKIKPDLIGPFSEPPSSDATPPSGGDGDYCALAGNITLEYYGVEGDVKALRPALHFRRPTTIPAFLGVAPADRREEILSLSLNL